MSRDAQRTWVLVSDGVHAQAYVIKNFSPLRIEALTAGHFQGRREAQPHTDHTGPAVRFKDDHGARHSTGRHADPHRLDKEIFVEHLADFVNGACRGGQFDRLILIAPDKALGDLRRGLVTDVQNKIKSEIVGEWTKLSHVDLEKHLADHVPEAT